MERAVRKQDAQFGKPGCDGVGHAGVGSPFREDDRAP